MADLLPITYTPPALTPTSGGLYSAVSWNETSTPRWLDSGAIIRPTNHGFDDLFGVWGEDWCVDPDSIEEEKSGDRPDISNLTAFPAVTVWGFDQNHCGDLTSESRAEVKDRARHILDLNEQKSVETSFSARMITDAGDVTYVADIATAIATLDSALAQTGTYGVIHAAAKQATFAFAARAVLLTGGGFRTVLGNQVVFGGGYDGGLTDTLVATSPVFGWRTPVVVRDTIKHTTNQYIAIAERSVLVGYEQAVGIVTIGEEPEE